MGTRAVHIDHHLDDKGEPVSGAAVYVYDQHTEDLIAATIYAEDSDHPTLSASTQSNPLTTATDGSYKIWLAAEAKVDIKIVTPGGLLQDVERTVVVDKIPATGIQVQEEGTDLTQRSTWNFTGTGVTASDAGGKTVINVPGGITGITVSENGTPLDTDITTLDFLGADFDLTESPENEVNVVISSAIARDAEVAAAYQPLGAAAPANELGYSEKTSDQTGIGTSATDVTDLSVAVTVGANPVLIVAYLPRMAQNTAAGTLVVTINEGATVLQDARVYIDTSGREDTPGVMLARETPSAGSHTYKVQVRTSNNTCDVYAAATGPAFIQVLEVV